MPRISTKTEPLSATTQRRAKKAEENIQIDAIGAEVGAKLFPPIDETKYTLAPRNKDGYKPRDDFIRSLVCVVEVDPPGIEQTLTGYHSTQQIKLTPNETTNVRIASLAGYYVQLQGWGCRLPKFTRWVTGLWPNDKSIVEAFARLGQSSAKDTFYISDREVDILRCADTPHFTSCFKTHSTPGKICSTGVGVCVIYADDNEGKMRRRTWGLHAVNREGKDCLAIQSGRYGSFSVENLAQALKKKFPDVSFYVNPSGYKSMCGEELTLKTGFTANQYFDCPLVGKVYATKVN